MAACVETVTALERITRQAPNAGNPDLREFRYEWMVDVRTGRIFRHRVPDDLSGAWWIHTSRMPPDDRPGCRCERLTCSSGQRSITPPDHDEISRGGPDYRFSEPRTRLEDRAY
jgi:hypothetical protein